MLNMETSVLCQLKNLFQKYNSLKKKKKRKGKMIEGLSRRVNSMGNIAH